MLTHPVTRKVRPPSPIFPGAMCSTVDLTRSSKTAGNLFGAQRTGARKKKRFLGSFFWVSQGFNDALYPSKSGLRNKHTVKHTGRCTQNQSPIINHIPDIQGFHGSMPSNIRSDATPTFSWTGMRRFGSRLPRSAAGLPSPSNRPTLLHLKKNMNNVLFNHARSQASFLHAPTFGWLVGWLVG